MTLIKMPSADVGETIIVVEDEVLIRAAIADYLRSCGYRVLEAAHAEEAVTVLQAGDVRVDIVLSCVQMRGDMNGFALRRWVAEHRPDVDMILAGTPARAVDSAADLCESGPKAAAAYDPRQVLDRIKRMLAARKPSRKSA